ncbi:RQC domain-containing protein, partial [Burkholderia pseudomallei]
SGLIFGASHLIEVVRGARTEKVEQRVEDSLSTFGIGAELCVGVWGALLRLLVGFGYLGVEVGGFGAVVVWVGSKGVLLG